ncbi:MAG TPA: SDR family oxidoreductase [Ignavibacteriaceae bacterium]|nr:SDR family oxidoreductase [Ignavibacteriaceae bacterium]
MPSTKARPNKFPQQQQEQPGKEHKMHPRPEVIRPGYKGSEKLKDKVAIITGGDSGIGRSVAVHYAREGADVAVIYLSEDKDAEETKSMVEKEGRACLIIKGDVGDQEFCYECIDQIYKKFGRINILVNNAGEQHPHKGLDEIDLRLMVRTFRTNIFAMFYMSKAVLKYLSSGDSIINSTSVTSYRGSDHLIDYSSTKGAITSFTRSLGKNLASQNIRVNAVAPGPIWTPLIPSTFDDVTEFGSDTPLGRAGQPSEVGPAYVFLASEDASYITSQVIHVNGGDFTNS